MVGHGVAWFPFRKYWYNRNYRHNFVKSACINYSNSFHIKDVELLEFIQYKIRE